MHGKNLYWKERQTEENSWNLYHRKGLNVIFHKVVVQIEIKMFPKQVKKEVQPHFVMRNANQTCVRVPFSPVTSRYLPLPGQNISSAMTPGGRGWGEQSPGRLEKQVPWQCQPREVAKSAGKHPQTPPTSQGQLLPGLPVPHLASLMLLPSWVAGLN